MKNNNNVNKETYANDVNSLIENTNYVVLGVRDMESKKSTITVVLQDTTTEDRYVCTFTTNVSEWNKLIPEDIIKYLGDSTYALNNE